MNPAGKENNQTENAQPQKTWSVDDFEFGGKLGRGRFGNVYVVRLKESGLILALKVIYKTQIVKSKMEFQIRREIEIQANLRHVNILRLYGYFHDDERIYFILEFAPGGDVYKHLRNVGRFSEDRAARYIAQVAAALAHMHRKHVIHRDIKPENLLIGVDKQIRMSDFGWSVHTPEKRRQTICGTVDYLPPEMVDRLGHTFSADLWCLGVLMYEFLIGCAPFETATNAETQDRIRRLDYTFPRNVPVSEDAKDLIKKLLKINPKERLSLVGVLNHPWIRKNARSRPQDQKYLSMRAEVESPFRTFRIGLLTFFLISAGIASLVATSQLIGSLGNAPAAMPLVNTSQTFAIDIACVGAIAFFLRGDLKARDKQIARISREETLAGLRLQLASGKTLPLGRLRSFCRPVMFYGTSEQVAAALEAAAPFKEELLRRGVFLVPLPLKGGDASADLAPLDKDDKESAKWEGRAVRREEWRDWFESQAATAGKNTEAGLYVGLRLDGRVRASGAGSPPWSIIAKQLAPVEGMWGGFLDGMDGRVGG